MHTEIKLNVYKSHDSLNSVYSIQYSSIYSLGCVHVLNVYLNQYPMNGYNSMFVCRLTSYIVIQQLYQGYKSKLFIGIVFHCDISCFLKLTVDR